MRIIIRPSETCQLIFTSILLDTGEGPLLAFEYPKGAEATGRCEGFGTIPGLSVITSLVFPQRRDGPRCFPNRFLTA